MALSCFQLFFNFSIFRVKNRGIVLGLESQELGDPTMGLFQVFWAAGSPGTGMAFPGCDEGSSTSLSCGMLAGRQQGAELVVEAHFGDRVITWGDP